MLVPTIVIMPVKMATPQGIHHPETAGLLSADQLSADHSYDNYFPGTDVTTTTQIEYTGTLNAVGVEVELPTGLDFCIC